MPFVLLMSACVGGDTLDTAPVDSQDSSAPTQDTATIPPEQVGGATLPRVVINELVALNTGSAVAADGQPADWLELYNTTDETVSLAGWHLTDDWRAPERFTLGDDVSIEAGGFLVFWVDGDTSAGADHLNFELSDQGEAVGLFGPDGEEVDWVLFPSLGDDVALARLPDGADDWAQVAVGTPGAANQDLVREAETALAAESEWAYHDRGVDLGTSWREPAYADGAWARGSGPFGYGDGQTTALSYGDDSSDKFPTAYFRTSFTIDGDTSWVTTATLGVRRDDGAAVYLNGVEVVRTALPDGELTYDTLANVTASSSDETTYFAYDFDPGVLVEGGNVLAVEVHQAAATSSDLSFDATLELVGLSERE